jgi:cation:H+ antiporter
LVINIVIFLCSCVLMVFAGQWLVRSLSRMSELLGLKRFTVAFLLMSLATAAPEMLIGISSAVRGISELSLGNILGQNLIHFTLAVFICVLSAGSFSLRSRAIRTTSLFSAFMALFPLLLILDGNLSRVDGVILIILFFGYIIRMIRNSRRHEKYFDDESVRQPVPAFRRIYNFFVDSGRFITGALLLILAAQGIVKSSLYFADFFDLPLVIIGVLIVGLGTALPEVYFSAFSGKKGDGELMAGNLLGSTVVSTSLVLGIVSIISPINNIPFWAYFGSRLALFVSVILFILFIRNDKKINLKEASVLLLIYLLFVFFEI